MLDVLILNCFYQAQGWFKFWGSHIQGTFLVIFVKINFYFLYNFAGRNFIRGYSTKRITTHYSVVPRETDPRWEGEC